MDPYKISGNVIHGYGRGSKELGFPTANIDIKNTSVGRNEVNINLKNGVYYGKCNISNDKNIYPMVMSIGNNPHYNNEERSFEVHIINKFENDFYGELLNVTILGYIRPMSKFESLEKLIEIINNDIKFALLKLNNK